MFIYVDKEAGRIYIVMEYCEGGDLSRIMGKQKDEKFFEEKQASFYYILFTLKHSHIKHDLVC